MKKRIRIKDTDPAAYVPMGAFEKYLAKTDIPDTYKELIKIRASQINGCIYCIDMHTADARKAGETEQRIYGLNAWREAPYYSKEERAILALTEEVTLIHQHGVSDAVYDECIRLFGDKKTAQLIMVIITINAWNRIGVSTRMLPREWEEKNME